MRTGFCMVTSPVIRDEVFDDIAAVAKRIHALRGDHEIHLHHAELGRIPAPRGDCVSVHKGEDGRRELIGSVFFPETLAYVWPRNREALSAALLRQKPELQSRVAAEIYDFPGEGAAA